MISEIMLVPFLDITTAVNVVWSIVSWTPYPRAAIKFLISFLIFHISTLRSPSSSAMMVVGLLQPLVSKMTWRGDFGRAVRLKHDII
jgi:hypothetical protein